MVLYHSVKEQINKYGYYFEFMMDGTIEYPLWHYYTDDDHKRYSYTLLCAVEPGESRGSLEDIKEDDLLYFGPVETEEYKDWLIVLIHWETNKWKKEIIVYTRTIFMIRLSAA